jgi:hypothetical protein
MRATIYELSWGGGRAIGQTRYFRPEHQCDAAVRLAEKIVELDRGPDSCAWAALKRLPDSVYPEGLTLVSWTKTSDERPTHEGFKTLDAAHFAPETDAA